jgi:hypothetical protein
MRCLLGISLLVLMTSCQQDISEDKSLNTVVLEDYQYLEEDGVHQIFWNFEDEFSQTEEDTLKLWIGDVKKATESTLGVYPFDMHLFFYKANRGDRPVGFGHTSRKNDVNEIHFYVNPEASFEDLRSDWTAPHEMSHLAIPFLGKKYKWFAEGFATYLSRRIMIDMGYFTEETFDSMYVDRIGSASSSYSNPAKTFSEVSDDLFSDHKYSAVYWGGAGFFYTADKELQEKHDMRFTDLLKEYLPCCRLKNKRLKNVIRSFDRLIEDTIFKDLLYRYENEPCINVVEPFS